MSIGHEVGVIKLPDMAAGHGNPSVLTNQIQRYITELSAAGSMYDQFSSAITLDGDFDISIDVYITSLATQTLLGRETGEDYFLVRSDGAIRVRIDSTDYQTAAGIVIVNQFAQVRARRVGTTLDILYAGVNVGSFTGAAGTMTLDRVGQFADTFYLSGMWANLLVEANGTLIVDAKKDGDGTSNIIVNAVGTPYLTRVNQTSADASVYTQVSDGWEGEEEEPQPFNTSTWTASSGDTLVPPNQVRLDSAVGGMFKNYGIYGIHRIVVDAESDAATLQMKDSPTGMGADPDILVTNPMNQTIDYDFINGGIYFRNLGEVTDVCTVRQVSIKRFLEVT
jgi:hypothetical protein